jgi:hypothetical protein
LSTIELTTLRTLDAPALPTEAPVVIARANQSYKRVLVRNVGPVVLLIATTPDPLASQTPSDVFELPVNTEDVIPISPSQTLYAGGVGGGGRVTVSVSPGIPLSSEWMRS